MKSLSLPALALFLALAPGALIAEGAGHADHVVVVVWDGLRPDLVTETSTPVLFQLMRSGVFFSRHHPVYPSSTEVNGTAIATGDYPFHSGLLGNHVYRPDLDPLNLTATDSPDAIRKGDQISGGKYLNVPTIEERLQALGFPTLVAGTKGVALLNDRGDKGPETSEAARHSVVVYEGTTVPIAALDPLIAAQGAFPPKITYPNLMQDAWTTQAVVGTFWKDALPKFTLLWLSDPDFTQHDSYPGADPALQALRSSDHNLSKILDALDQHGLRAQTDVIVVSDHGFSTVSQVVDVADLLRQNGFKAGRHYAPGTTPQPGDIFVAGNGGTVFFYVIGRDPAVTAKLVAFLQQSDFAGVVMTRDPLPGTFPLALVNLDAPGAPDVAVAMRWTNEINHAGVPGMLVSDLGRAPGQGNHTSLSRFDMHNTLIAAGPDFRKGWTDPVPSGNTDIAPTVAAILGIPNDPPMDGRVLTEALRDGPADKDGAPVLPRIDEQRLTATAPAGEAFWNQYLQVKTVNGTVYFDEGNGGQGPAPIPAPASTPPPNP